MSDTLATPPQDIIGEGSAPGEDPSTDDASTDNSPQDSGTHPAAAHDTAQPLWSEGTWKEKYGSPEEAVEECLKRVRLFPRDFVGRIYNEGEPVFLRILTDELGLGYKIELRALLLAGVISADPKDQPVVTTKELSKLAYNLWGFSVFEEEKESFSKKVSEAISWYKSQGVATREELSKLAHDMQALHGNEEGKELFLKEVSEAISWYKNLGKEKRQEYRDEVWEMRERMAGHIVNTWREDRIQKLIELSEEYAEGSAKEYAVPTIKLRGRKVQRLCAGWKEDYDRAEDWPSREERILAREEIADTMAVIVSGAFYLTVEELYGIAQLELTEGYLFLDTLAKEVVGDMYETWGRIARIHRGYTSDRPWRPDTISKANQKRIPAIKRLAFGAKGPAEARGSIGRVIGRGKRVKEDHTWKNVRPRVGSETRT